MLCAALAATLAAAGCRNGHSALERGLQRLRGGQFESALSDP